MRHGSLFSGIGGFDLAAEWMGWENVFQVEIDSFCQKVLEKNFPNTKRYGDIKEFDGTKYRGTIDVLSGGFPCQPYSIAGKRKGKEDSRHLWPEMLRVIREVKPTWVVGENVSGLVNWSGGVVFEEVHSDLESQGYEVQSILLPAAGVGARHRRERIWFIAHSNNLLHSGELDAGHDKRKAQRSEGSNESKRQTPFGQRLWSELTASGSLTSHAYIEGLQGSEIIGGIGGSRENSREQSSGLFRAVWKDFPTQPPLCGRVNGVPNRVHRIKGLGNAIVPQVAYEIFKAINQIYDPSPSHTTY